MSDASWYYLVGGAQQVGPVDTAALGTMIGAGSLAPGNLVWREGMAGWQPWESVPELAAFVALPAPGLPPPVFPPPPAGWQPAAPVGPPGPGAYAVGLGGAKYPKAPLGARFVAMLIDGLVFGGPAIAAMIAMVVVHRNDGVVGLLALAMGLFFLAAFVYGFLKDGLRGGQSWGKRAMKLMVVHLPTNLPCSKAQSALRYLVLFGFNFIPYVGWLVEPIVAMADGDGRRLGDRAAGTQVIALSAYRQQTTEGLGSVFT
jgi:uncharacterized RDD family membrane protein YckC